MVRAKDHFLAIIALPFMVIIVVPGLLYFYLPLELLPYSAPNGLKIFLAAMLFIWGTNLFVRSISFFHSIGKGTLAPWKPTQNFVCVGPYRYVRNPMISGVVMILLAEGIFLEHAGILIWAVVFFLINHVYFILREEPNLERRFGESYVRYKKNVRRWIPRLNAWETERNN